MAIFNVCTDLETRELRWVPRDVVTDKQSTFAGIVQANESYWWAGRYADAHRNDVRQAQWG